MKQKGSHTLLESCKHNAVDPTSPGGRGTPPPIVFRRPPGYAAGLAPDLWHFPSLGLCPPPSNLFVAGPFYYWLAGDRLRSEPPQLHQIHYLLAGDRLRSEPPQHHQIYYLLAGDRLRSEPPQSFVHSVDTEGEWGDCTPPTGSTIAGGGPTPV